MNRDQGLAVLDQLSGEAHRRREKMGEKMDVDAFTTWLKKMGEIGEAARFDQGVDPGPHTPIGYPYSQPWVSPQIVDPNRSPYKSSLS